MTFNILNWTLVLMDVLMIQNHFHHFLIFNFFFFGFWVLINTVILIQLKGNKANPLRESAHTIKIQQKLNIQRRNIKKHKIYSCCKMICTLVSFPEAMLNLYSWNHSPSKFLQSEMRAEWAMFTREGSNTHSTTSFSSSSTSIFLAII